MLLSPEKTSRKLMKLKNIEGWLKSLDTWAEDIWLKMLLRLIA